MYEEEAWERTRRIIINNSNHLLKPTIRTNNQPLNKSPKWSGHNEHVTGAELNHRASRSNTEEQSGTDCHSNILSELMFCRFSWDCYWWGGCESGERKLEIHWRGYEGNAIKYRFSLNVKYKYYKEIEFLHQ